MPAQGFRSITMRPRSIAARSTSPFTGQQQIQAHQGQWWEADVAFPPMKQSGYADDIAAFLTGLNGIEGTFLLGDSSRKTPRGTAQTNLLGAWCGASQSGLTLGTGNWIGNQTVLRAGDYIQLGGENRLLRSEDFSHAAWTKSSVTVTADAATAPDGNATADLMAATGSDSNFWQQFTSSNSGPATASIYLKTPSGSQAVTAYLIRASPFTVIASTSFNVTTSWARFSVAGTLPTGSDTYQFQIGGGSTFGTGAQLHAWGAQVNDGSEADGYIGTTSAAVVVTRRLHKITRDAVSDPAGNVALNIWPRLRETPATQAKIKTSNCVGTFRLASDPSWSVDPAKIYDIGFSAVEAI